MVIVKVQPPLISLYVVCSYKKHLELLYMYTWPCRAISDHYDGRDIGDQYDGRDIGDHYDGRDIGNQHDGRDHSDMGRVESRNVCASTLCGY